MVAKGAWDAGSNPAGATPALFSFSCQEKEKPALKRKRISFRLERTICAKKEKKLKAVRKEKALFMANQIVQGNL